MVDFTEIQCILNFSMEPQYIKSFSQGQITIPKAFRDNLGIGNDFWLKLYLVEGKIIAEPVGEERVSRDGYLSELMTIKGEWFDVDEWKKMKKEISKRKVW